ncbi:hypothetical protein [Achromobacter ruhlandii]|uniref:hypothetical protein n=1 Tax=Achromobacter ruhlandii TaxID=72557 RepID=UPI0012FDD276|nr:hypothetical protein [Achromobacter ruhlandii]
MLLAYCLSLACLLLVAGLLLPGESVGVNRDAMNELWRNTCRRSNPRMSHRVAALSGGRFA